MKANLSKYHVLLGTTEAFKFETSGTVIRNSHSKKLLGGSFGSKERFEKHINTICIIGNIKLNALARLTPDMELEKRAC